MSWFCQIRYGERLFCFFPFVCLFLLKKLVLFFVFGFFQELFLLALAFAVLLMWFFGGFWWLKPFVHILRFNNIYLLMIFNWLDMFIYFSLRGIWNIENGCTWMNVNKTIKGEAIKCTRTGKSRDGICQSQGASVPSSENYFGGVQNIMGDYYSSYKLILSPNSLTLVRHWVTLWVLYYSWIIL